MRTRLLIVVMLAELYGKEHVYGADVPDVGILDVEGFYANDSFKPCTVPAGHHCYTNATEDFYCRKMEDETQYYFEGKSLYCSHIYCDACHFICGYKVFTECLIVCKVADVSSEMHVLGLDCFPCFMPHQCLDNNRCATGTTGKTCEKCFHRELTEAQTYYRVGNSCQPCYEVPYTILVFLFYLVIVVAVVGYNGLTVSVAVKIRQMVSMMQLVMLTLSVKVLWKSKVTLLILQQFGFILGDVESSLMVACYQNAASVGFHCVQWLFILSLISFILGVGGAIDRGMRYIIKYEPDEDRVDNVWRWRMMLRRLVFALIVMLFSPLLSATCQSYSCAAILKGYTKAGKDYYLFNQIDEYTCEHTLHQFVNMLLFLAAFALCIVAPLLMIFAGMVAYKWNTLSRDMVLWGWYFESFKPRYSFWEALPLMLRLVYVACTDVYVISPQVSLTTMFVFTCLYLIAVAVCRPYKEVEVSKCETPKDIHNIFEGVSLLGVVLFQLVAMVEVYSDDPQGLDVGYSIVLVYFLLVTIGWLILCCHVVREIPLVEFEDLEFPVYAIQEGNTDDMWNMNMGGFGSRSPNLEPRRRRGIDDSVAQPIPTEYLQALAAKASSGGRRSID